ncbi:hypothetical protein BJ165DRAFT_1502380 [Panaeolus papilionaceus]|nr:hypothetical protein BJ165DRAFT_1502380 [Panaeolus papilionaceus]
MKTATAIFKFPITHVGHKAFSVNDTQRLPPVPHNNHDGGPTKKQMFSCAMVIKTPQTGPTSGPHPDSLLQKIMQRRKSHRNSGPSFTEQQVVKEQYKELERLPSELWMAAVEWLPRRALLQLAVVNRFFYEIAMDLLYAEVDLEFTNSVVKAKLVHLLQPCIAKRIKHLRLTIEYFHWSSPEHTGTSNEKDLLSLDRGRLDRNEDEDEDARSISPGFVDFIEAMEIFGEALPNMRHVRTLFLRAPQTATLPRPVALDAVLETIWKACGMTLENFSYQGSFPNLLSVFRSPPPPKIELALELRGSLSGGNEEVADLPRSTSDNKPISIDAFLSGFRRVSSQLRSFHLIPSLGEDLSPIYARLKEFATLDITGLGLQSPACPLSDPSAVTGFLDHVSPHLKQFTVYYPGKFPSEVMNNAETTWNSCLMQCLTRPNCFANLRVLNIYPTRRDDGLDTLLAFVRNSEVHLEEISIEQRYWGIGEIETILSGLKACKNLRYLKLSALQYNSTLIDCLAQSLPNLWSLHLQIQHEPNRGLEPRRYDLWKLYDIALSIKGKDQCDNLMLELSQQIPSVKSFFGSGNMDLEDWY